MLPKSPFGREQTVLALAKKRAERETSSEPLLASKGVTGTYSATGCGALVRSSAASLRDDGRLESSCWARGTSSVRIPVGYEGSAVGRVAEGWEPFALRSDFCATTRNVFPRPPTRSTAARARTIC